MADTLSRALSLANQIINHPNSTPDSIRLARLVLKLHQERTPISEPPLVSLERPIPTLDWTDFSPKTSEAKLEESSYSESWVDIDLSSLKR